MICDKLLRVLKRWSIFSFLFAELREIIRFDGRTAKVVLLINEIIPLM